MVASRYQTSFGYAPRMSSGAYPGGGPRNALAPVYSAPPVGSIGGPVGMPQAPAMAAPAPSAPSLTGGTGALSGGAMRLGGDGVGYGDPGDEYGGPGPQGAPSTGNFGQDLAGFGRNAGGIVGMALGGPMGIAAGTLAALGIGAINSFAPETARAVFSDVFGMPGMGGDSAPTGTSISGNQTSNMPAGITDQQMFNFNAPVNPTEVAPASVTAGGGDMSGESFGGGLGATDAPPGTTGMGFDGSYGGPQGFDGYGDFGGFGGYGGDNGGGGESTSESAGNGTGDNAGDSKRYGGVTRYDTDGVLDEVPIRAHENEFVLRPEATMHYGPDLLHALNSGIIPVNALMGLAMARRPTASNHLLQMMMR